MYYPRTSYLELSSFGLTDVVWRLDEKNFHGLVIRTVLQFIPHHSICTVRRDMFRGGGRKKYENSTSRFRFARRFI